MTSPCAMKPRRSAHPGTLLRLFLPTSVLLAGAGFMVLAAKFAGSIGEVLGSVMDGSPGAPGFFPFVFGVLCVIYGAVGLLFRGDAR